ncbi:MAG: hypothetical protein AB1512_08000 [Thermodesulfobacteriota bacterium]
MARQAEQRRQEWQRWPEGVHDQTLPTPPTIPQTPWAQTDPFFQGQITDTLFRVDLVRRIDALEKEIKEIRSFFKVSGVLINTLGSTVWDLKQPLAVAIELRGREDFVGCLYDLDLYGYGETIPEAMEDLKSAIVNQFNYLLGKEKEVELSEPLERQLAFLKNILVPASA